MPGTIEERVSVAVDGWLRWVPGWTPATYRGRAKLCRRCTGSPLLAAAGMPEGTPHQVTHALVSRMQRIIDKWVDDYTAAELPALHAELTGEELWRSKGYDPVAGLAPEYDGIDPDPEPDEAALPYLFPLTGLAEETKPAPPLPRPPLSAEEKQQLRREIQLADSCAEEAGAEVCFALVGHRPRIETAIHRFVEPQIQAIIDDLSRQLEPPS